MFRPAEIDIYRYNHFTNSFQRKRNVTEIKYHVPTLLDSMFIFFKTMVVKLYKASKLKFQSHLKNPLGLCQSVYDMRSEVRIA